MEQTQAPGSAGSSQSMARADLLNSPQKILDQQLLASRARLRQYEIYDRMLGGRDAEHLRRRR
jgi:hypothetical protein